MRAATLYSKYAKSTQGSSVALLCVYAAASGHDHFTTYLRQALLPSTSKTFTFPPPSINQPATHLCTSKQSSRRAGFLCSSLRRARPKFVICHLSSVCLWNGPLLYFFIAHPGVDSSAPDQQEEYIKDEMKNLKRELIRAKEEIKRIQSVPLVIGQFNEIIDANYGIVGGFSS